MKTPLITREVYRFKESHLEVLACRLDFKELLRREVTLTRILSDDEKRKLRARTEDRLRFLAGRILLRFELGNRLSLAPAEVPLARTRWGKPVLGPGCDDLLFNLAHSGENILLAMTSTSPVGVDVETTRRCPQSVIERFHPLERATLAQQSRGTRPRAFGRLWAAKEACMKCRGRGSISSVEVTLAQKGRWQDIEWHRVEPSGDFLGVVAVGVG